VDVWEEAYRTTFEIAATVIVGVDRGSRAESLYEAFHDLTTLNLKERAAEIPLPLPTIWDRRHEIRNRLFDLLRPVIEGPAAGLQSHLLGRFVNARHRDGSEFSAEEIIAHVNTILLAGHITATSLCAFLIHLLAQNPLYLQRVFVELEGIGSAEAWTRKNLASLEALDRALLETERMYPPIASLPREVTEEFDFAGFHFPSGTLIHCSIAGAHYLRSIFRSPGVFDPDRFAWPRVEHRATPFSLVAFSTGPRSCLGLSIARMEVKAIVGQILRRFRLQAIRSTPVVALYRPVCMPACGMQMYVSPAANKAASTYRL
jgi:cytochrome P450